MDRARYYSAPAFFVAWSSLDLSSDRDLPGRRSLPVLPTHTLAPAAAPGPTAEVAPWERRGAAAGVRVALVTLGCDKNTVDSERLLAEVLAAGARLTGDVTDADVVVVNTCGFIEIARAESVDALLDAVRLKEAGRVSAVIAVGCLVQRYKDELRGELPELDLLLGTTEAHRLVPELRARGVLPPADAISLMERPLRVLSGSARHTSYLKISEGCDHGCAFCAIPLMRGKHRSTPIAALVREARELEAAGVVELNIVSQDTTWYGRDLLRGGSPAAAGEPFFAGRVFDGMAGLSRAGDGETAGGREGGTGPVRGASGRAVAGAAGIGRGAAVSGRSPSRTRAVPPSAVRAPNLLPDLLGALLRETSIPWFRLFYLYPSGIDRGLVECIAREPRIVRYVDMPIQHGADPVLERMRRPERRATIRERVRWLRESIPDVALRSTVIVGFPGEQDEDFEAMLQLLEELRFDHLGAFAYSVEEGTPAAGMPGQVPEALRRERLERVLELQRAIALERNEARIGRETEVLVEGVGGSGTRTGRVGPGTSGAALVGRAPWQAPELDGIVTLRDRGRHNAGAAGAGPAALRPGMFVRARIVGVSEDDLDAQILD